MRHLYAIATLSVGALLVGGCDNAARVTSPGESTALLAVGGTGQDVKPVQMLDQCDPTTFNAVIGPGTCASNHSGITFDNFLNQLIATQVAPAWRFAAPNFSVAFGTALVATNRGGEFHTFTKVAQFGGGVVPFLNQLAGTPIPAPECLAAAPSEFIAPGGSDTDIADQQGTMNFECCIHPWMRTTVRVR